MKEILINENECISLGSIGCEQDLVLGPGTHINPPPEDGRCECCGRHLSELKPFGKAGDPLVGDFEGALLVKTWRPMGPYDEEAEKATEEAMECFSNEGYEDPLEWMIGKYGEEKGKQLWYSAEAYDATCAEWLCRDCIVLDQHEYFERLRQRRMSRCEN